MTVMEDRVETIKQHFNALIQNKQLNHAYAFSGEGYDAKVKVAQYLTQGLACPHFDETSQPCQHCSVCQRIAQNQFSDLLIIEPEGQNTRVDQIRQLKDWLAKSPVEADFKVAIITRAETMNASAANALLKFLEEPSENVYLMLFTPSMDNLLPTIRSRVQQFHIANQSVESRVEKLKAAEVRPHHATIIAQLASDSLDRWLETYDADTFDQWLKSLNIFYQALVNKEMEAFVVVQTHLKSFLSNQQGQDGLEYLLLLNHQMLILLNKSNLNQARINQWQWLEAFIATYKPTIRDGLAINQALLQAKQQILANVSGQLAYEGIVVSISST